MKTERWFYLDSYIFIHTHAQTEYKINDKHANCTTTNLQIKKQYNRISCCHRMIALHKHVLPFFDLLVWLFVPEVPHPMTQ